MQNTQFHNPDAEYRIHPFWFWNGDMKDQEIVRQISEMHDKGVGGFFICPRQGLQIPYLSEAWFEKVQVAVKAAKEKGMHVWLYDEYPYPSGIAGGEVTLLHPEAKHQTLEVTEVSLNGGAKIQQELPWAKVIYAKAVPVSESGERNWAAAVDIRSAIGNWQADPVFQKTGLTTYNQKRFFTYRTIYRLDWQAPEGSGQWDILVYQEKEIEDFKYYGTFVDPCSKEAMSTFIRLTHERYKQYIGEEFGKTVKGMFTDEIGLLGRLPWTPRLEAFFRERNGYSITEHLPALSDASYQDAARIRYDYYQSVHELLTQSYHKQVYDWCEENGLQYVAEVPSVRMTTQRFSHVPGGDSCHEKLGRSLEWIINRYASSFRDNPKMMSSIARQLGRERNLDECFHSVGWSMNLQDAKWMIDRMAAFGTNMYTFHAFFYTVDGLTQHDAPPSQFYQNPYWQHFRQLGDYAGRISYVMTQGTADIRIAMIDPTTTLWTHMSNPLHHFDYAGTESAEKERMEQLKGEWRSLGGYLLQSRRDYDHMDAELLAEAQVVDGKLTIGKAAYSVLVLPPMTNLEQKAWETVKRFLNEGGTVIAVGELPKDKISADNTVPEEAAAVFNQAAAHGQAVTKGTLSAYYIPRQPKGTAAMLEELDALLSKALPRAVTLDCGAQNPESFLLQSRYVSDTEYLVFASNQEDGSWNARITIQPGLVWPQAEAAAIQAELLDVETGAITPLAVDSGASGMTVELPIAPYASRLIRFTRAAEELPAQPAAKQQTYSLNIDAEGPWKLTALNPNALRFEDFTLAIGDMDDSQAVPVQAKTFIDQCADAAEAAKLPLAFKQIFGTPKELSLTYPIPCRYKVRFFVEQIPAACSLLMDQSAILGEWTLKLNGTAYTMDSFRSELIYDNANVICDVQSSLQKGWNELVVEVSVQHDWDGVVDALNLYGSFGVRFNEEGCAVLTEAPAEAPTLTMGRYYPGYPYYAGTWSFTKTLTLSEQPDSEHFTLGFPDWEVHDSVEVLINGQSLGVRPWSPYQWEGETKLLRQGGNELEVRVTGTLIGLLEGKYFDYHEHRVVPV